MVLPTKVLEKKNIYIVNINIIANEPAKPAERLRSAGEAAENSAARRNVVCRKILDRPMKVRCNNSPRFKPIARMELFEPL